MYPARAIRQSAWTNHAGGFWVFGGQGFDSTDAGGLLNDLWEYVP